MTWEPSPDNASCTEKMKSYLKERKVLMLRMGIQTFPPLTTFSGLDTDLARMMYLTIEPY